MAPRVLVIDDDPDIRGSLSRGLTLLGFTVEVAADGEDGLVRIAADPPDAVVLDVTMPGLTGIEVCARIRAAGLDTPVCILSARDSVTERVAGLRAGADDYLVKPFSLEELRLRLVALLSVWAPCGRTVGGEDAAPS